MDDQSHRIHKLIPPDLKDRSYFQGFTGVEVLSLFGLLIFIILVPIRSFGVRAAWTLAFPLAGGVLLRRTDDTGSYRNLWSILQRWLRYSTGVQSFSLRRSIPTTKGEYDNDDQAVPASADHD